MGVLDPGYQRQQQAGFDDKQRVDQASAAKQKTDTENRARWSSNNSSAPTHSSTTSSSRRYDDGGPSFSRTDTSYGGSSYQGDNSAAGAVLVLIILLFLGCYGCFAIYGSWIKPYFKQKRIVAAKLVEEAESKRQAEEQIQLKNNRILELGEKLSPSPITHRAISSTTDWPSLNIKNKLGLDFFGPYYKASEIETNHGGLYILIRDPKLEMKSKHEFEVKAIGWVRWDISVLVTNSHEGTAPPGYAFGVFYTDYLDSELPEAEILDEYVRAIASRYGLYFHGSDTKPRFEGDKMPNILRAVWLDRRD